MIISAWSPIITVSQYNDFPYLTAMNLDKLRPDKYLKYLYLPNLFATKRTKEILSVNPTVIPQREEAKEVRVSIFDYNAETIEAKSRRRIHLLSF